MSQSYLEIAKQGKNALWRYFLGILLILFCWIFIGTIATLMFFALVVGDLSRLQEFLKTRSTINYIIQNINFIFFAVGIFLTVRFLHERKFLTLVSAEAKINFRRLFVGFGAWFLILASMTIIGFVVEPENFEFAFQPSQWLILLPFALILTPIQTSTEELFFRGYLIQGLSLITKKPLILMFINGILFMLPHLPNPEIQRGPAWVALYFFAFGVFCSFVTLKDNRLELALGIHAANNLLHIFVTTKDSALPVPAIWFVKETGNPQWLIFWFLIESALFYLIAFGVTRKNTSLKNS
ncbi:CPBP family intramembrane glutamic endopeptidase [Mastigocoleus testarum]|uniref:CAAX protease n=1 Tax=Mastigocoleus testarum BC008 TaxID=371196 RepID=A0A0V7ZRM2_9CYAN|nr:type II CAAX endopeptidase family protein [Mastigocoleus testarum]KST67296.1 CAAX protease [Mastigocoleus testarum BC008]